MSGGAFQYVQYRIDDIITRIEEEVENATKPRPEKQTVKFVSVWQMIGEKSSFGLSYHEFQECVNLDEVRAIMKNQNETYKVIEDKGDRIVFEENGKKRYVFAGEYEEYPPIKDEYGDIVYPYYPDYTEETLNEFRKGIELLKQARIYAQRIDWLISGDDGEENFHKRLKEELEKIQKNDIQR